MHRARRDSVSSNSSFVLSPGTHASVSDLDGLSDLGSDFELVSEDGDISDAPSSTTHAEDMSLSYPEPSSIIDDSDNESLSGSSIFRSTVIRTPVLTVEASTPHVGTPLAQSVAEPVTKEVEAVVETPLVVPESVEAEEKPNAIAKTLDVLTAKSPSFWLSFLRSYKPAPGLASSVLYCAGILALISVSGSSWLYTSSDGHKEAAPLAIATSTPVLTATSKSLAPLSVNSLSILATPSRALALTAPACGRLRSCDVAVVVPTEQVFLPATTSTQDPLLNLSTQAAWQAAMEALNVAAEAWTTAHHRIIDAVRRANLTDQSRRALRRSQRAFDRAHGDSKRLLHESKRLLDRANREVLVDFREAWLSKEGKERKKVLNKARHGAHKLLERHHLREKRLKRRHRAYEEVVAPHVAKHRARCRRSHSRRH